MIFQFRVFGSDLAREITLLPIVFAVSYRQSFFSLQQLFELVLLTELLALVLCNLGQRFPLLSPDVLAAFFIISGDLVFAVVFLVPGN